MQVLVLDVGYITHCSHTGLDFARLWGDGWHHPQPLKSLRGRSTTPPAQFLESLILRRRQMTIPIGTLFGSDRTIG